MRVKGRRKYLLRCKHLSFVIKQMNNLIVHDYNGFGISQRVSDGYVNATQLCKSASKQFKDWYRLVNSKPYIDKVSGVVGIQHHDLVIKNQGGSDQDTWVHKLIAVEIARWISLDFSVWANTHLLELMETGVTAIQPTHSVINNDTKTIELITNALDHIFQDLPIDKALIAGVKINAIQSAIPSLALHIEPARQLLINSTAKEAKLLTPTQIGELMNPPKKPNEVNQLLIAKGYQIKNPNKRGQKDLTYVPTDKAKEHCSITIATGKGSNSTTYQQLRWYDSIISLI